MREDAVLRADALLDAALGVLLLLAPWGSLFDALGLPRAQPALYAQIAGGLLLAFAYLLWIAPRESHLTRGVAAAAALANAAAATVLVAWLVAGDLDAGGLGVALLAALAAALAAFAVAEALVASRSVAMLLPPD